MLITDFTPPPGAKTGLIPRDYGKHPSGYLACAQPFPDELLIPESEWQARLDAQKAAGSALYELAHATPIIDQDGFGYCWAHSSTMATNIVRLMANEPYVPLSAFAVAAIIKGGRDEGGWGSESLEWIAKNGIPSQALWPQGDASLRHDTPEMRADAAKRKVTEWWDGSNDRERNKRIMVSALLLGWPCVADYNYWSHSVCAVRLWNLNPLEVDIKNSWKDWGDNGIGRLSGDAKAVPDGLVIPRVVMPSTN